MYEQHGSSCWYPMTQYSVVCTVWEEERVYRCAAHTLASRAACKPPKRQRQCGAGAQARPEWVGMLTECGPRNIELRGEGVTSEWFVLRMKDLI
jgi:hypothetical protein